MTLLLIFCLHFLKKNSVFNRFLQTPDIELQEYLGADRKEKFCKIRDLCMAVGFSTVVSYHYGQFSPYYIVYEHDNHDICADKI